jgi:hypothetical protein
MGKGGGGSPPPNQQVTTTTSNLPEYARPYFENLMQRGQAESYRQYQPYEAERLAGFTPGQVAAQQETLGMQTPGQFGAATGLTGAGGLSSLGAGQQFFGMAQDPSTVQAFMSPYQQSVTDVARKAAIRDAQIAQQQINLGAVRQGTYGGARQALAQSERERGLLDRLAGIQAEGSQKAFEDARRTQQFGSDLGLRGVGQGIQAGQTLGQLGQAQQQADLQRLTAQETVGGQQRGFEQQRLDQQYADFLRQRDYPLEQLGYFSNLLRGVPVGLSSTQTTSAPPPSIASQIGGLGLAGLGIAGAARTAGFAEGGEVSSYAMGGGVMSPEELERLLITCQTTNCKQRCDPQNLDRMKILWRLVNFKREIIFVKQLWLNRVDSNRLLPTCLLVVRCLRCRNRCHLKCNSRCNNKLPCCLRTLVVWLHSPLLTWTTWSLIQQRLVGW